MRAARAPSHYITASAAYALQPCCYADLVSMHVCHRCLGQREGSGTSHPGPYVFESYTEVDEAVRGLARSLVAAGACTAQMKQPRRMAGEVGTQHGWRVEKHTAVMNDVCCLPKLQG